MDTRRRSDPGRRLLIALPLALAPAAALARGGLQLPDFIRAMMDAGRFREVD
ncbi:MAG: hypothetical protein ACKOUS_21160 [Alphaproteobacteria bacterium]